MPSIRDLFKKVWGSFSGRSLQAEYEPLPVQKVDEYIKPEAKPEPEPEIEEYIEPEPEPEPEIEEYTDDMPTADIHLGIDFGTSYTKACYYLLDKEIRRIVEWKTVPKNESRYFLPSVLWMDGSDTVSMRRPPSGGARDIRYLKMASAGQGIVSEIRPSVDDGLTAWHQLYSSFYLANVFKQMERFIKEKEKNHLKGMRINWSGSLGIPVSYLESDQKLIFSEILHAARFMQKKVREAEPINVIRDLYEESKATPRDPAFECIPELYAEASGIFSDYHTSDGYYTFFDVGGGTVDGAVIHFTRQNGEPHVNFLTSKVGALGVEVVAEHLKSKLHIDYERAKSIVFEGKGKESRHAEELVVAMRKHTAEVIVHAKDKAESDWRHMNELPIFLCGGGQSSAWHRAAITSTHGEHQHARCGIPRYAPQNLETGMKGIAGLPQSEAHRFLIAVGLAIPQGYGPVIDGFPKDNPMKERHSNHSKEDLEEVCREKYGG